MEEVDVKIIKKEMGKHTYYKPMVRRKVLWFISFWTSVRCNLDFGTIYYGMGLWTLDINRAENHLTKYSEMTNKELHYVEPIPHSK